MFNFGKNHIMQLKKKYVDLIDSDLVLQGKIATVAGKSVQSVALWAKHELHEKMTMLSVLKCIAEYTETGTIDELVEETESVK